MKKTMVLILGVTLLGIPMNAQNETKTIEELALGYMAAYSEWNPQKMGSFYADSVQFKDPTALEVFGPKFNVQGKDELVELMAGIFPDGPPEYVNFAVKDYFVSGTYAVVNSTFELVLPKQWYGEAADGEIFVSVPITTILRFKEGKLVSHQDYVDYNNYQKQIKLQLKEG